MRQGWKRVALVATLVACALAQAVAAGAAPAKAKASSATARTAMHQFSGVVTVIDRNSLTVEKQGRSPRTMQFVRDEKMSTQGEVEAQAHVTVYYRDVDGKPTAQRVVVRTSSGRTL
ncbi:MAG: hypothetical protein HYR73_00435 [Candidatus Eisenbacteria bacterium]|nr:hypothetical protein [Candidatus Eisenbacteria bacterium]